MWQWTGFLLWQRREERAHRRSNFVLINTTPTFPCRTYKKLYPSLVNLVNPHNQPGNFFTQKEGTEKYILVVVIVVVVVVVDVVVVVVHEVVIVLKLNYICPGWTVHCPLSTVQLVVLYVVRGAVTRNYLDDIQMCCLIVYNHQPALAKTATRTFSINTRPGNKIKQLLSPPWPLGNRYKIEDTCNIWKFLLFNYSRYPSFLSGNLMMEFLPQK